MPRYGICTSLANALAVRQAGWDFVEENAQTIFRGTEPDDQYNGTAQINSSALPIMAVNCLVPGNLKITGPAVDPAALRAYMANVLRRAGEVGCRTLVFGSGGARQVPDGWDKARATDQIIEFGKWVARLAHEQGVTVVLEHLCLKECNIVNTLAEEFHIVRAVRHANFQCLLDTYHLWTDGIPLSEIEPLLPYIRHVHLADKEGRVPPGQSGTSDYRPVFAMLKEAGYNGALSVEASGFGDLASLGPPVLAFLKKQWSEA